MGNIVLAPGSVPFTDTSGNAWALSPSGIVLQNGRAVPAGSGTGKLAWIAATKQIWAQDAATGNWFEWRGSNWNGPNPHDPTLTPLSSPQSGHLSALSTTPHHLLAVGFLSVEGSKIIDSDGKPVQIASANWSGAELGAGQGGGFVPMGLWQRNYRDIINLAVDSGLNALAINYSDDCFDNLPQFRDGTEGKQYGIDQAINPDLTPGMSSLEMWDKFVSYAGSLGLRIIFRRMWQASTPPFWSGRAQTPLWYDPPDTGSSYDEAKVLANLQMLARHYAGNTTVIGIEINNEIEAGAPPSYVTWGDGNVATDFKLWVERAANAIHATNSDILIIAEAPQSYSVSPPFNHFGAGDLSPMVDPALRPVVAAPNKLVYSVHSYPPSLIGRASPQDSAHLDRGWGFLLQQGIAPVLVTEFGIQLDPPAEDVAWLNGLTAYIKANKVSWSSFYWGASFSPRDNPAGEINDTWDAVVPSVFNPLISLEETR